MNIQKIAVGITITLVSCSPTSTPSTTEPSVVPSATSVPSASPSPQSSPTQSPVLMEPTPTPVISSTPNQPLPTPTHLSVPTPEPTSSTTPPIIPENNEDCSKIENEGDVFFSNKTLLKGKIIDEDSRDVEGVSIRVKSLDKCTNYGAETITNEQGEYSLSNAPAFIPLEIEIASPTHPSAFYKTTLVEDRQDLPRKNYFPFRVKKPETPDCIAIAPSPARVSGEIFNNTDIPQKSESLVRLRSLDGCNSFDELVMTDNQKYSITVSTIGGFGQLTVSFAGRPTEVRKVVVNSNRQNLPEAPCVRIVVA